MPDDPALANERLSSREIVETALVLLRASYVFPDLAEQAAVAIEAKLAAGEYDGLDEEALAERLTSDLDEVCDDKHLRVRTMPPRPARPKRGEPSGPGPGPARPPGRARVRASGHATTASIALNGWTVTSATSTCAGSPAPRRPDRSSPPPWN